MWLSDFEMTEVVVITISEEQVAAAEAEVTEAERVRSAAEEALMESPNSTLKSQQLAAALKRVAQTRANARELREAYEKEVAEAQAVATREELEKAAASEIRAAGRELKGGRQELVAAAERAQEALVALMAAVDSHNALIGRHAAVLGAAGLGLDGETGGGQTMLGAARVRIKGEGYEVVDPGKAAAWLVHRLVVARLPYGHGVAGILEWVAREVAQSAPGLAGGVPEPERVVWPEPLKAVNSYQAMRQADRR